MGYEICWAEIIGGNQVAATAFYSKVFGWKIQEAMPGYAMFGGGKQHGCGFMAPKDGMPPNGTVMYVAVPDIAAKLSEIEQAGGRTIMPKTEIPGHGWFGLFTDPNGNVEGLYTQMAAEKKPAGKKKPAAKTGKKRK